MEANGESTRPSRPPPAYTPAGTPQKPPQILFKLYRSTFFLVVIFIALLVVPWVVTCFLDSRPVGTAANTWTVVKGTIGEDVVENPQRWYRAITVLNTVAAVLTVPVLSVVLSHAAVVVIQRRPHQKLSALEMLSLVDAPWSRLWPARKKHWLFHAGFGLVFIGFAQLFLQSVLVTPEQVHVVTFLDAPDAEVPTNWHRYTRYRPVGQDPSPYAMSRVPRDLVSKEVVSRLSVESVDGIQTRLWLDQAASTLEHPYDINYLDESFQYYSSSPLDARDKLYYFASAFPSSLDTGALRYHATRLNSTISCTKIDNSTFPETCSGSRPFVGDFTLESSNSSSVRVRWCVPGAYDASPWTLSRDRQDITEEMFISVLDKDQLQGGDLYYESSAMHCAANTTRGPFELPNAFNKHRPGPLLDKWPSPDEIAASYNDRTGNGKAPLEMDTAVKSINFNYHTSNPYRTSEELTPGPLTTVMVAMLGNTSWFHVLQNDTIFSDSGAADTAYRETCSQGLPLASWESSGELAASQSYCTGVEVYIERGYSASRLEYTASSWFFGLAEGDTDSALSAALFFANEATLTRAATTATTVGVDVYTSAGRTVTKPAVPLAAKIAVSILLGAEVLALAALVVLIYRAPTFTRRIDALATAVMGAQLFPPGSSVPQLGSIAGQARKALAERDGLIGVRGGQMAPGAPATDAEAQRSQSASSDVELQDLSHQDLGESPETRAFEAPVGSLVVGGMGIIPGRPGKN